MNIENYIAANPTSGPMMLWFHGALLGLTGLALIYWACCAILRALDAREARLRYEADRPRLDADLRAALDSARREAEFEEVCRRG